MAGPGSRASAAQRRCGRLSLAQAVSASGVRLFLFVGGRVRLERCSEFGRRQPPESLPRAVASLYGGRDETCPISTGGGRDVSN
jgi:hypothetical protein